MKKMKASAVVSEIRYLKEKYRELLKIKDELKKLEKNEQDVIREIMIRADVEGDDLALLLDATATEIWKTARRYEEILDNTEVEL